MRQIPGDGAGIMIYTGGLLLKLYDHASCVAISYCKMLNL